MIHVSKRADTARKFPQPVWRTHVTCLQKPCSRLDTHATGTGEVIKLPKLTCIIRNALTYTEGKCAHTLENNLYVWMVNYQQVSHQKSCGKALPMIAFHLKTTDNHFMTIGNNLWLVQKITWWHYETISALMGGFFLSHPSKYIRLKKYCSHILMNIKCILPWSEVMFCKYISPTETRFV